MKSEIKQHIEAQLTKEYLLMEASNRFYDYFDEEDLKDRDEIDVILEYESEEIPLDIMQEITESIKTEFKVDIYQIPETEENKEIEKFLIEKIRIVYPFYNKYHEDRQEELKKQQKFMDLLGG